MTNNAISVKLDVKSGALEITAPEGSLEKVFEQVRSILPALQAVQGPEWEQDEPVREHEMEPASDAKVKPQTRAKAGKRRKVRPPRPSNGDGNQGARLGAAFYRDFEPIDLGVPDNTEIDLSKFYNDKSPQTAKEKVLVAGYIAHKYLNREHFNYDEAFQIMRTSGESSPPKNISSPGHL